MHFQSFFLKKKTRIFKFPIGEWSWTSRLLELCICLTKACLVPLFKMIYWAFSIVDKIVNSRNKRTMQYLFSVPKCCWCCYYRVWVGETGRNISTSRFYDESATCNWPYKYCIENCFKKNVFFALFFFLEKRLPLAWLADRSQDLWMVFCAWCYAESASKICQCAIRWLAPRFIVRSLLLLWLCSRVS